MLSFEIIVILDWTSSLNNRNLFTSGCQKMGTPGVPDCQENSRKNTEIFFTVYESF